jgi:hypothetical protein
LCGFLTAVDAGQKETNESCHRHEYDALRSGSG